MILAFCFSLFALLGAAVAFLLTVRPMIWVRLWSPWHRGLIGHVPARAHAGLMGIRMRAGMFGTILVLMAFFIPAATSQLESSAPTPRPIRRAHPAPPMFDLRNQPTQCSTPQPDPGKLSDRLKIKSHPTSIELE